MLALCTTSYNYLTSADGCPNVILIIRLLTAHATLGSFSYQLAGDRTVAAAARAAGAPMAAALPSMRRS